MIFDWILRGGTVIDGSGKEGFLADVGILDGKIAAVGELSGAQAKSTLDVTGRLVTPGFIDIHRHADAALFREGFGDAELFQGLTTIVNGNCGLSIAPSGGAFQKEIFDYLIPVTGRPEEQMRTESMGSYLQAVKEQKLAVNIGMLTGGGTMRAQAAGFGVQRLDDVHYRRIHAAIEQALSDGALGVSLGLGYAPECFYTTQELIAALADTGSVLEFGKGHTHAVTALGKMAGRTVAFIYTGKGDTCDNRMKKIARFVRFADCYNIPVVSLVDSTGLKLFDTVERQMAVLSAASTLVYAYSEATTVKVTLVIGNAIGSAYVAMGGSANADMTYVWPGSVISPMTGEAAIQIMWKDKIMASKGDAVKAREELAAQYEAEVADGVNAAVEGLVDDVIDPADSRKMVIAALEILSSKRDSNPPKKHGNMPL